MSQYDHKRELARIDYKFDLEQMKNDRKFLLVYLLLATVVLTVNLVGGATSIGLLRAIPWLSAGFIIGVANTSFLKYKSLRRRVKASEAKWGWSREG